MMRKDEEHWNLSRRIGILARYEMVKRSRWLYYILIQPHIRKALIFTYLAGIVVICLQVARCGDARALDGDDAQLFVTVGAMVAGMLAIVFALSVLLIQNAAATQSSGLFDVMARDRWQDWVYWTLALIALSDIIIAGALLGFPEMLSLMSAGIAMGILIFTTGFSLLLVFLQLSRTYDRINPLKSINYVKSSILRHLSQLGVAASHHSKYVRAKVSGGYSQSDAERLAAAFLLLRPQLSAVSSRLTFLFDYHDKLFQQREMTAARLVLRAIGEVAVKYIEIRRDSFFVVPSSHALVTVSDSQVFFRDILESLVAKAKHYMRSGDDGGATEIVRILEGVTAKAMDVKFIGDLHGENPLVQQTRAHMGLIITHARQLQHTESLFQAVKSLGRLGQLAAAADLHMEALAMSKDLHTAAIAGVVLRQEVIWTEALGSLCVLLEAYGTNPKQRNTNSLSFIFDYLRSTLNLAFRAVDGDLVGSSSAVYTSFSSPFETTTRVVHNLAKRASGGSPEQDVPMSMVIETCETYQRFLRQLSEEVKSADSYMVEAAAKSICQTSKLLIGLQDSSEYEKDSEEVQKALNRLVNQLGWFAENAEEIKHGHNFDSLVESAAKIGLRAVEVENSDIACTAIRVIEWLAKAYVDKVHGGYREFSVPRIMKRACLVGLLAFKRDMTEPLKLLKETIAEIDAKAEEQAVEALKASGESQGAAIKLIENEVGPLYYTCTDEKYNHYPLVSSSQHTLFALIECSDIDDFCEEIWGFKASERYTRRYL